jgi:hypothetical protein
MRLQGDHVRAAIAFAAACRWAVADPVRRHCDAVGARVVWRVVRGVRRMADTPPAERSEDGGVDGT